MKYGSSFFDVLYNATCSDCEDVNIAMHYKSIYTVESHSHRSERVLRCGLSSSGSGAALVSRSCEDSNQSSESTRGGVFLDLLRNLSGMAVLNQAVLNDI